MIQRPLRYLAAACAALLTLAVAVPGLSAQAGGSPRLTVKAHFEPATAKPGDTVKLVVKGRVTSGFHIYGAGETTSDPTKLTFSKTGGLEAKGDPVIPVGVPHEAFGLVSHWIEGSATFSQEFVVPAGAAAAIQVEGVVDYMACTESYCDPPAKAAVTATLQIEGAGGAGAAGAAAAQQDPNKPAGSQDPGSQNPGGAPEPGTLPDELAGGLGFDMTDAEELLEAKARYEPAKAKVGQQVDLIVTVTIKEGWHVYGAKETTGTPVTFVADEQPELEQASEVSVPAGEEHDLFGTKQWWISGTFEMRQRFTVTEEAGPGDYLFGSGNVRFMVCNDRTCLDPSEVSFDAELEIVDADAATEEAPLPEIKIITSNTPDKDAGDIGWGRLLILAFGAGLLALVMPCTYPMIPITFSFFTKQADARGGNVMSLALTYGAGIITIFIAIGVLAAPIIQPFALHWATNLVIGLLFIVFAFALFGLITLEPPRALQDIAGKASTKGGYAGVFLMGLCLVITSFTCTVPFVGTMLALSAAGGIAKVVVGMATFGLTMAVPFVFLALLPGKVRALPRAGEWMNTLKVTLGFVELAAALKFISNVDVNLLHDDFYITRPVFLVIWIAIFLATAAYLFGIFSKGATISGMRKVSAGLFLALAGYCGVVMTLPPEKIDFVMSTMLPPTQTTIHEVVADDIDAAFELARKEEKYLLLNFTGFG